MIKDGLNKIVPNSKDYSLLHTFGATNFDAQGLPEKFSIYDGRDIPNQNALDIRFEPFLPPLPMGCVGETVTFNAGLQDGKLYNPKFTYDNTPPKDLGGRDMREGMKCAKNLGLQDRVGTIGFNRGDYFNVYGAGKIDDFDAVRIALWINQIEKRGVLVGTYWYPQFNETGIDGVLPTPSFNTAEASRHAWLITGWDGEYLEGISWQGKNFGNQGVHKIKRVEYNALMQQPWTGAFTQAKTPNNTNPIPLGFQVYIDHLVYFIRSLFNV